MSKHHRLFIAYFALTFPKAKRRRCCDVEQSIIFNARLPLGRGDRTLDGGMCGVDQLGDEVLCVCVDVVVQRVINDDISCIALWCGSNCEPVMSIVVWDDGSTREGRHFSPCEALTEMSKHHRLFIASFAWTFPKAKRRRCCDGEQSTIFNTRLPLGRSDRSLDVGMCGLEQPGDQVLCVCVLMLSYSES